MSLAKIPALCNEIRQQIVERRYIPGERIPPQAELLQQYGVSSATMQKALTALAEQGVVEPKGRQGTFVADKPPFLNRIALLSPMPEDDDSNGNFFKLIHQKAPAIAAELGLELACFYGYEGWRSFEDYQRVVEEMESDLFAGFIFATNPYYLDDTPLVDYPGIPRFSYMQGEREGFHAVWGDYKGMIGRSLDYFADKGCRRFGLIGHQLNWNMDEYIMNVEARGMEFRRHWFQVVPLDSPHYAENVVTLLMSLPKEERPDCLLLADDNMVYHATQALVKMGMRVPDDLVVLAHANLPWPSPSAMPIPRIGFRLDEYLRYSMKSIVACRKGEDVAMRLILPALFENEINPVIS